MRHRRAMIGLPHTVTEALDSVTYYQRALAYLQIDANLRLVGAGGNLENYGLGGLEPGRGALDQAFFLEGLLPPPEIPYLLPSVELNGGRAADVHFYLDDGCLWVVLLDATAERDQARRMQQKAYDVTLLQEREALLNRRLEEANAALLVEKERSEQILLNILPSAIVTRLNSGETVIADQLSDVTILFADLVGFTKLSSQLSAGNLVRLLNGLFSEFDRLARDLGVEKIKTVGDSYMLASGLPEPRTDHAHAVADMALAMIDTVKRTSRDLQVSLKMRIGIHSGDVVAGVIGTHKFVYDIWGDAVNVASRMESHGMPNRIQVSAATHLRIRDRFRLKSHGAVGIRGKGAMETFILLGRRHQRRAASQLSSEGTG